MLWGKIREQTVKACDFYARLSKCARCVLYEQGKICYTANVFPFFMGKRRSKCIAIPIRCARIWGKPA